MEGLGISTVSTSSKTGKRFNGNAKLKGKQSTEPPTTYTVSKIDAGQAVLISDQIHCIEFPSILLPPGCTTGSVISISCTRNFKEEQARNDEFWDLQDEILSAYGERSPEPPRLRLRNVTQTSVTLEWDRLDLATSKLLSLTIWRNGQRLAAIPNPLNNTSTKVSGLDVDAPYSFHLIMRTTAGTYASQTIKTRTLTLADTSGIAVCFGSVVPPELLNEAKEALTLMRARWSNRIQIETTHFVCTQPSGPAPAVTPPPECPREAPDPGSEYQRASQLSIPIVQPAWILACLREKRMVPISAYTLDKGILSGGPSSSASLAKNASSRSQQHAPQQAREAPREAIQLQKPPPPKNVAPEATTTSPLPEVQVQAQQDAETATPAATDAVQKAPEEIASKLSLNETELPQSESAVAHAASPPASSPELASEAMPDSVSQDETVFAAGVVPTEHQHADDTVETATEQEKEATSAPDSAAAVVTEAIPSIDSATLKEATTADEPSDAQAPKEVPSPQTSPQLCSEAQVTPNSVSENAEASAADATTLSEESSDVKEEHASATEQPESTDKVKAVQPVEKAEESATDDEQDKEPLEEVKLS